MNSSKPFKWRHFHPEVILLCVRWYLRYSLSYRDMEEIMQERGLRIDHSTLNRYGQTIDFMLSAKRDQRAAKRFFRKVIQSCHAASPYAMTVDNNPAFPVAFTAGKESGIIPKDCKLRRIRYLNNIVEQDHRFIKRLVKPGMGFGSFWTAKKTLAGFEAMNMVRKGQVQGVPKGDILG